MNILFFFPLELMATRDLGDGFVHGFEQLGHKCFIFGTGEQMQVKKMLLQLYREKFHKQVFINDMDLALEGFFDYVILHDIDMVIVIRGIVPSYNYIMRLKKLGVKTILYSTEDPYDYDTTKLFAKHYDYVFSNDPVGEQLYTNGHYIATACNEDVYKPLDVEHKNYDICFVGTFFKERVEFFNECLDLLKRKKVYFAGHWVGENAVMDGSEFPSQFGSKWEHPIREILGKKVNVATPPSQVNVLYNYSKIIPNPHRNKEWLGNTKFEASNLNPRVFEAVASGAFQLVSGNRRSTVRRYFDEEEMAIYDTPSDFTDACEYWLSHDDERQRMVERARIKVLANHTYGHRAEEILQIVNKG